MKRLCVLILGVFFLRGGGGGNFIFFLLLPVSHRNQTVLASSIIDHTSQCSGNALCSPLSL